MSLKDSLRSILIQCTHWEYWPWKLVYGPVFIQYIWHSLLSGKFTYPTLINRPYMEYGGIIEESKWEMYLKTPNHSMPKTILYPDVDSEEELKKYLDENGFDFPLIIKPDLGMRGVGIEKVNSFEQLLMFKKDKRFRYLIQEYLKFDKEIGLFIFKNPKTDDWELSSIMLRGFPKVIGNGKDSLEKLIRKNRRAFLQLRRWKKEKKFDFERVLNDGEELILDHIGNHRLGTKFIDGQHFIDEELRLAMKSICQEIEGLEYGRLDIAFNSWEELKQLKNYTIIEINGANAEPAHIYDPKHSLIFAWRCLFYHFRMQYLIAKKAKQRGEKAISHKMAYTLLKGYNHTMSDLK